MRVQVLDIGWVGHATIVGSAATASGYGLIVVVWTVVGMSAAWAAVRLLGLERGWVVVCGVSFTPYATLAAVLPLALALATGRWLAAAVAAAAQAVLAGAVLPRTIGRAERGDGPVLRVLTANLLHGACDPDAVVELVRESNADVVALQEYTPEIDRKLRAAGLAELLVHRLTDPAPGGRGAALFSRYPLSAAGLRTHPGGHRAVSATVAVPGTGPVHVECVHPLSLYRPGTVPAWRAGLAELPAVAPDGPVRVLLGDFNATLDHRALRALLGTGYRDAAAVVGRGLIPTWPYAAYGPVPRLTLDHVLADRRVRVGAVTVHPVPGSDHRAVCADLILPPTDG
jgi:endonuclease/exonuclease/phosphatase (EEP) superfamily protein YafD